VKYRTILATAIAVIVPALALGQATHSIGTANTTLGILKLFGSTSGDLSIKPPAVAGTASTIVLPSGSTDFTGTVGVVQQATTGAAITVGTVPQTQVTAVTFATGTTHTLGTGGITSEIWECTGACTVTPPTPAAGYQFLVRNTPGTTGVITIAGVSSVLYEKTDYSGYGTANTSATSGGALGDKICLIGHDATHYDVGCFNGTWAVP
jgi:hypothetical protein